ncbi:FAD-dependent monooxygenase [Amorphus sp. 3PC139-8]|uniref:FAD-dependent monooxygenase n=1 Tax=Amorphus sp. 3PC139-8 TaxID=2735676 RepID=UPI00345D9F58
MEMNVDVVVVGGGPVGLFVASELALRKVSVAVLERRLERVSQSRALTVHGRTLELFALRGIAERFLSRGVKVPTGHFAVLNTRLDFSVFETEFPFTLFLPQAVTEELLEERALELGVRLFRGHVVETVAETGEGVEVAGEGSDGRFRVTADYVVGADGARSVVRNQAGIVFEGHPNRASMMLADVVLGAPPDAPVVSTHTEAGCLMLAPLGDGVHHRIVAVDPDRTGVPVQEPVTLEEITAATMKILGRNVEPHDPIWLSRFGTETRLAETYRKGRILLCGDAAHVHTPAGGQGMNVGLQDAMNLGWKLARVARKEASDDLLNTYEAERHPVGQTLFRNTLAQTSLIANFAPGNLALRETLDAILQLPPANRLLAEELSGFGIRYEAPLLLPHGWRHDPGHSGRRALDRPVRMDDGRTVGLHEMLTRGDWLLVRTTSPNPPIVSVPGGFVSATIVEGEELVPGEKAILVRPDGYVGPVFPAG